MTAAAVCGCGREFAKAFGLRVHQRTCPAAVSVLAEAERTLTASEALALGWFVAEFCHSGEVWRCYGSTAQEARDRLEYDLAQEISVREPA